MNRSNALEGRDTGVRPASRPDGGPGRTRRLARRVGAAGGLLVVLMTGVGVMTACGTDEPGQDALVTTPTTATTVVVDTTLEREAVTHDFVVPAGTADRIAKDEKVEVVPDVLEVHVGDRIRVRNDDTELARLGIFDVGAGETITMNFNTPGEFEGIVYADASGGCGVPPPDAQTFTIIVHP